MDLIPKTMKLDDAITVVQFPELALVLIWQYWLCFTDIEVDALEYLVKNSSRILLPNVKVLTEEKVELLKKYKGYIDIGIQL